MSDKETRIKKIIADKLHVSAERLAPEYSFVDDLGADSLAVVELIMAFEDAFDIEIPDDEAAKITTVKAAFDYLIPLIKD